MQFFKFTPNLLISTRVGIYFYNVCIFLPQILVHGHRADQSIFLKVKTFLFDSIFTFTLTFAFAFTFTSNFTPTCIRTITFACISGVVLARMYRAGGGWWSAAGPNYDPSPFIVARNSSRRALIMSSAFLIQGCVCTYIDGNDEVPVPPCPLRSLSQVVACAANVGTGEF